MKPRATRYRCTIPGISVRFADGGNTFAVGETVDLDAVACPGLTWREALGDHVCAFEPVIGEPHAAAEE
jgi:hypothetical protein